MRVALLTTFKPSKKEPLAAMLGRIQKAFVASGQGQPFASFSFSDAPLPGSFSSVDHVLRRYPQLERFVSSAALLAGGPEVRQISNGFGSPAAGQSVPFATLLAIADGVPRSFPFHVFSVQLHGRAFGAGLQPDRLAGAMTPGVLVGDLRWINGRKRSLSAWTLVDADLTSEKLPSLPEAVLKVFAACGTEKNTVLMPLAGSGASARPTVAPKRRD